MRTTGRNDPCPCGSGRKYKNCCLRKDQEAEDARNRAQLSAGPKEEPEDEDFEDEELLEEGDELEEEGVGDEVFAAEGFEDEEDEEDEGFSVAGVALIALLPTWVRFLEARKLVTPAQRKQVLEEVAGLRDEITKAARHFPDDPELSRARPGGRGRPGDQCMT